MHEKQFYVYILTNKNNAVLYTGVTSELENRIWQHKNKAFKGFTTKYNIDKLVYYEIHFDSYEAIAREKQIKAGSRQKKIQLIEKENPEWKDIADAWFEE